MVPDTVQILRIIKAMKWILIFDYINQASFINFLFLKLHGWRYEIFWKYNLELQ